MTVDPPRLTANYQPLPQHSADGYRAVSRLLLSQLGGGFPRASLHRAIRYAVAWYETASLLIAAVVLFAAAAAARTLPGRK